MNHPQPLLAPNPGPMTGAGTNTWIAGSGPFAVIDPGPDDPRHLKAILSATGNAISHILVTHAHLDHSALAPQLAKLTGAPVIASAQGTPGPAGIDIGGGEGVDTDFVPDIALEDGDRLDVPGCEILALHTPGHHAGHFTFFAPMPGIAYTGDTVLAGSTTLISPPDGELAAYMRSLDRLSALGARAFHPGHGPVIEDPATRIEELRAHRLARHEAIRAALREAPGTAADLAARVYTDIDPALLPAAARNVLAHLLAMQASGEAECDGIPRRDSEFRISAVHR